MGRKKEIFPGPGEMICRNVRLMAKAAGWKLGDLERAVGLSVGYFARCRQSASVPAVDTVYNAAKCLGVTIEDLLDENLPKRLKQPAAKAAFSEAVEDALEVFSREELAAMILDEKYPLTGEGSSQGMPGQKKERGWQ